MCSYKFCHFHLSYFQLRQCTLFVRNLNQIIRSVWTSTCRAQIFSSSSSDCWAHTDGGSRPSLVPVLIPVCRVLVPAARDLVPAQDLLLYRPDQSEHCGFSRNLTTGWTLLSPLLRSCQPFNFWYIARLIITNCLDKRKGPKETSSVRPLQDQASVFIQIRILFANNMLCRD